MAATVVKREGKEERKAAPMMMDVGDDDGIVATRKRTKRVKEPVEAPPLTPVLPHTELKSHILAADMPEFAMHMGGKEEKCGAAEEDAKRGGGGENPLGAPPSIEWLMEHLSLFPKSELGLEVAGAMPDQKAMVRSLQEGRAFLPLLGPDDESAQMGAAGTYEGRIYPPCRAGTNCIGLTGGIRVALTEEEIKEGRSSFKGACLQQFMYPSQLAHFERTGSMPLQNHWCILCYRKNVMDAVLSRRGNPSASHLPDDGIIQFWRCVPGGDGNYAPEHVLTRIPKLRDGLIDAWVMYRREYLYWEYSAALGKMVVNQSSMLWKPEPSTAPQINEVLADF